MSLNRIFALLSLCCTALAAPVAQAQNYSDIWWNPNESGWGLTIADHETQLFAVWYTYAANGNPTWFVIPGGTFSQGRRLFSGDIYQTTGPACNVPFNTNLVIATRVGTADFDFSPPGLAPGTALYSYSVGSVNQTKQIQRQPFGNAAPNWGADFTDIWWDPNESGWGLTLAQHGNNIFGVWFTYDLSGNPLWVVLPGVTFSGGNIFSGTAYTTTGPYFATVPFDPAKVVVTPAGSISIAFTGRAGTFTTTACGITQTKSISGQPFGNPPPNSPPIVPPNVATAWIGTATGTLESAVIVQSSTANVTWTLDRFVNNVAVYRPAGIVSATITFVGCSNGRLIPSTHTLDPSTDGTLTIDYNANPPTYHGAGLSTWSATLACDEGSIPGYEGETDYFGGSGGPGPAGVEAAGAVSSDGVTIAGSDSRAIDTVGMQTFQWIFTRSH